MSVSVTLPFQQLPHGLRADILNDIRDEIHDEMPFVLQEVAVTEPQRTVMNDLISQAASLRAQALNFQVEVTYV